MAAETIGGRTTVKIGLTHDNPPPAAVRYHYLCQLCAAVLPNHRT
jgi:hypothetical protein